MLQRLGTLLLAALVVTSIARAQNVAWSSGLVEGGQEYLVSFVPMDPTDSEQPLANPLVLLITSSSDATVTMESAGGRAPALDRTFSVRPGEVVRVPVSVSYLTSVPGEIDQNVIRVRGNQPLTVSALYAWQGNGESFLIHPVASGWGVEYRTVHAFPDRFTDGVKVYDGVAHASVIAAYDSTELEISTSSPLEPGADLVSHGGGRYTASLDSGERLYLRWSVDTTTIRSWGGDPTGTLLVSSKPIGVVSGMTKSAMMRMPNELPNVSVQSVAGSEVRNAMVECRERLLRLLACQCFCRFP